ncbi:MAG: DUF2336 domain-containing protein, partial [Pseudomonadota bacterium]|nr:DUF2336 domain-containing protein [Pseudomonadota bacterium]
MIGMNRHADMDAEQLMQLAFDRSQTGRGHLAGAVTDMLSGSLNLRESDLIADILLKLVQGAEIEVRRKLAQRLAGEANAPHDLIAFLANDEIKVAHPVLVLSQVLTDTDLLKVISKRSDSHCHAIARRKELSVQVTSALVESGDPEAIRLVLINEGAELAAPVLKWLADLAKHNESIRNPLIRRKEITSDLAIDLYWWVSVELRHYILERYQIPAALIDEALEMTVQQLINTSSEQRKVTRQMRELAFQLSEADKITPQLLIQVLRTGLISFFSSLFVAHTGLDET